MFQIDIFKMNILIPFVFYNFEGYKNLLQMIALFKLVR